MCLFRAFEYGLMVCIGTPIFISYRGLQGLTGVHHFLYRAGCLFACSAGLDKYRGTPVFTRLDKYKGTPVFILVWFSCLDHLEGYTIFYTGLVFWSG